jgi:hypothetical protein
MRYVKHLLFYIHSYSRHKTFGPVKVSSGRLGASHLYDSIIMFHRLPPGSTVHAKKTGPDVYFHSRW